jgi:hypothetical protein
LYVDDGLAACTSDALYIHFMKAFECEFTISAKGPIRHYLGIDVHYDRRGGVLALRQPKYVRELLARHQMTGCSTSPTPSAPGSHITGDDCSDGTNLTDIRSYQQLIGALLYLANATRPDIAFSVNQCARFLSCPGPSHFAAAKRVLRYLAGTADLGLGYCASSPAPNILHVFVDADHAGNPEDRISVTGYIFMLNGGPIHWCSKRQPIVALSSTEAEYYAASLAGCDTEYFRRILADIDLPQHDATVLFEDNQATIALSEKSGVARRMKHIDTRVHRLRHLSASGVIRLSKIATDLQLADPFTKALPVDVFLRHRAFYMV